MISDSLLGGIRAMIELLRLVIARTEQEEQLLGTKPPSPYDLIEPGIKLTAQMSPEPAEADLQLVRQMGVEYVYLSTNSTKSGPEYYAERKAFFAAHGLSVYGIGNVDVRCQDAVVLGLPNRDEKVAEFVEHIRSLGSAGIPYSAYAHMPNGIWSTENEKTRGGASARAFDEARARSGEWNGRTFSLPLTHDRQYSEDEVWGHFETFIRVAAKAAEEEGVMIGIHPDDPPISRLGGVPRLFSSFENYKRALAIADSPNVGVCLCIGCWLEGGDLWGATAVEAIRYFAAEKKLFKVHFRNVSAPLPHFVETFVDDGYGDMRELMSVLQEVGFKGMIIPDHIPKMADDPRLGTAFTIGYMKALIDCTRPVSN